jgi:hypothetical protein
MLLKTPKYKHPKSVKSILSVICAYVNPAPFGHARNLIANYLEMGKGAGLRHKIG